MPKNAAGSASVARCPLMTVPSCLQMADGWGGRHMDLAGIQAGVNKVDAHTHCPAVCKHTLKHAMQVPPSSHALESGLRLVQLRLQGRQLLHHCRLEGSRWNHTAAAARSQRGLQLTALHSQTLQLSNSSPQVQLGSRRRAGKAPPTKPPPTSC